MLAVTLYVCFFERERQLPGKKPSRSDPELVCLDDELGVKESYSLLARILTLRPVQLTALLLLTCRIAFAATDASIVLKFVEIGIKKEEIAVLAPLIMPWGVLACYLVGALIGRYTPMTIFRVGMILRLPMILVWIGMSCMRIMCCIVASQCCSNV